MIRQAISDPSGASDRKTLLERCRRVREPGNGLDIASDHRAGSAAHGRYLVVHRCARHADAQIRPILENGPSAWSFSKADLRRPGRGGPSRDLAGDPAAGNRPSVFQNLLEHSPRDRPGSRSGGVYRLWEGRSSRFWNPSEDILGKHGVSKCRADKIRRYSRLHAAAIVPFPSQSIFLASSSHLADGRFK